MRIRLPDILTAVKLRACVCGCHLSSFILHPSSFPCRRGQTTVEYLLMLAVIAGMALILGVLFYQRILGGFFTVVGLVLGAGTPT